MVLKRQTILDRIVCLLIEQDIECLVHQNRQHQKTCCMMSHSPSNAAGEIKIADAQ